jgi:heme/copper-type cytochrome/quinol oxidase subunit 2
VLQVLVGEDVTIALTSKDTAHDLYVKGLGHIVHAAKGETAKGGLRIDRPGTYQFWCTVSGHKEGGMRGILTVTE